MPAQVSVDRERLAGFCRRHGIRKLAFFGSVLTNEFRPDSDVDVLVEFDPSRAVDFFALHHMEAEISGLIGGRRVDLLTYRGLNWRLRDRIVASSEVQYAEG